MYINVLEYIQDWVNECFTANVCQKISESFYTISFEYHRAAIRHLGCMTVLAYARISGPVSMSYRSNETNFSMATDSNVYMVVC